MQSKDLLKDKNWIFFLFCDIVKPKNALFVHTVNNIYTIIFIIIV